MGHSPARRVTPSLQTPLLICFLAPSFACPAKEGSVHGPFTTPVHHTENGGAHKLQVRRHQWSRPSRRGSAGLGRPREAHRPIRTSREPELTAYSSGPRRGSCENPTAASAAFRLAPCCYAFLDTAVHSSKRRPGTSAGPRRSSGDSRRRRKILESAAGMGMSQWP